MMRAFRAVLGLTLFLSPGALHAAPGVSIEVPAEVRPAGEYATFTPKGNAKSVIYIGLSGADAIPSELLRDPRTFLFPVRGLQPGRYRFAAVGALADEQARQDFVVLVGESPPGPTPPVPPIPPDPFVATLQAAYGADGDPDKAKHKTNLTALYRQGAELAGKPTVATWGDLFKAMKSAADMLGIAGKLAGVQSTIQSRLKANVPTQPGLALDAAGRALAAKEFQAIAAALEGIP